MESADKMNSTLKVSLAAYLWPEVRFSIIVAWVTLLAVCVFLYVGFLGAFNIRNLNSSLAIANETIVEAVEVNDWNFVLSALQANSNSKNIYSLNLTSADKGQFYAGPFGDKSFGFGEFCQSIESKNGLLLNGCSRILTKTDFIAIFLFICISIAFGCLSLVILKDRALLLFRRVADLLLSNPSSRSNIVEIDNVHSKLIAHAIEQEKQSKEVALAHLATQVAHDIKSPLSTLQLATYDLDSLADDRKKLIQLATQRISCIAEKLLNQYRVIKAVPPSVDACDASVVVRNIVFEKRVSLKKNVEIELVETSGSKTSMVSEVEFSSLVSNLLDNAIDAVKEGGWIKVELCELTTGEIELQICDSGAGFSGDALKRAGSRGFTFGKDAGNGLGLYSAKECLERWGGKLMLRNSANAGALVSARLPSLKKKMVNESGNSQ